jgi:hypothetical protein
MNDLLTYLKSILIFEMEISKLIDYLTKLWQSCQGNTVFYISVFGDHLLLA